MDLTSGYHQAPLAPAARILTAFACFVGVYHFTRLPFGLKGKMFTYDAVYIMYHSIAKYYQTREYRNRLISEYRIIAFTDAKKIYIIEKSQESEYRIVG
jgi:hypothetical protein